jgi:hypothetical protein
MDDFLHPDSGQTRSNRDAIKPDGYTSEPDYIKGLGWYKGYSFKRFWGNVHHYLDDKPEGVQQLAHHYYLQNGGLGAQAAARRIYKFLGGE